MNREQALAKIKKCLALGKSANPNEAAIAMRQAQALMTEHMLTPDDVALSNVKTTTCDAPSNSTPRWEVALARGVADAFGCEIIWTKDFCIDRGQMVRKQRVIFVGIDSAPEIAGYAWDVLSRQCAKGRQAHMRSQPKNCKQSTRTARGDEYAQGWVYGVKDKLQVFANPEKTQLLIEQFTAVTWPDCKTLKPADRVTGKNIKPNDFYNGLRDGKNANLKHGVGAMPEQGLLT